VPRRPESSNTGLTPPRWRLPLLVLALAALAFGLAGGLARLTPMAVLPAAIALHGALMVSAFFGTLISLERAAALDRAWAYVAPLCAGLGGILILLNRAEAGFVSMVLGAAVYCAASALVVKRQPSLDTAALLAGAAAWLAGNALLFAGRAPVAWWIVFFALTIGGERLELSRYLRRGPIARRSFLAIGCALLVAPASPRLLGAALVLLALWLFAFDIARLTVRQKGLTRYVAACLLAGYAWLATSGALMALSRGYDASLHAIFLGFVFSMVFGHAPVILPALLRVPFPYHRILYLPLALLHASLAVRVLVSIPIGAWGNAAAIALFIATGAALVLNRAWSGRPRRSAPGR
jgi:hypothetical protein